MALEPLDLEHQLVLLDDVLRGHVGHPGQRQHLVRPTGGDLADHDHEFDEVRWFELAEAGGILTFESERGLVDRAAQRVADLDVATWSVGTVGSGD